MRFGQLGKHEAYISLMFHRLVRNAQSFAGVSSARATLRPSRVPPIVDRCPNRDVSKQLNSKVEFYRDERPFRTIRHATHESSELH